MDEFSKQLVEFTGRRKFTKRSSTWLASVIDWLCGDCKKCRYPRSDCRCDEQEHGESYPDGWLHCMIHLNPETGEMHSDGDHRVREWIETGKIM